jgi:hypothetical protein
MGKCANLKMGRCENERHLNKVPAENVAHSQG